MWIKIRCETHRWLVASTLLLGWGCATVPPEFLVAMEREREGIELLRERHRRTVEELVENWHQERMERLRDVRERELGRLGLRVPHPDGRGEVSVVETAALHRLDDRYASAVRLADSLRDELAQGYLDTENWDRLTRLHGINLEMARSLREVNEAQRKLYAELVDGSLPRSTTASGGSAKLDD